MKQKKKILFFSLALIGILFLVFNWDSIYLRTQTPILNDAGVYINDINKDREEIEQSTVGKEDVEVVVSYTGNHMFLTKTYVNNEFEKAFLTQASRTGFLDWSYHTVPFMPDAEIKEEAFEKWNL